MTESNFETYIPIELIKSIDDQGNTSMKMRGIASTPSEDADEEFLDPLGFDSEYFLKHGYMNWNHQSNSDPTAIVGKPTSATVKGTDYWIEFDLFAKSKKAQQIFELQQVLEDQGLSLGLSIEGKVLERDSTNSSKVTKARITGCAITPNPKNADTVTEIMKGLNHDKLIKDCDEDEEDEEDDDDAEKALSAESSSGKAVSKESLDGDVKSTCSSKRMKKGEVVEKISLDLPSLSKDDVESIYNITQKIQKSIDMSEQVKKQEVGAITPQALEKAYEILNIAQKEIDVVEKTADVVEKGHKDLLDLEGLTADELSERKAQLLKGIEAIEGLTGDVIEKSLESPEIIVVDDEIEKAIESDIQKASTDELVKALTDVFQKQLGGVKDDQSQKFKAVGKLIKGFSDTIEGMDRRLSAFENETVGRKSITTQKQHIIEKSFAHNEDIANEDTKQYLNLNANKAQISKALTEDFFANHAKDEALRKSILTYDTSGVADQRVRSQAKSLGLIQ